MVPAAQIPQPSEAIIISRAVHIRRDRAWGIGQIVLGTMHVRPAAKVALVIRIARPACVQNAHPAGLHP